jgi:protein TonB
VFETIVNKSAGNPRARWATGVVSAAVHFGVLSAIALVTMYATDTLPEPRSVMVFVASAPAPPPPPAPMVAEPAPKPAARAAVRNVEPVRMAPVQAVPVAAAPLEAPAGIAPETGLEGIPTAAVEAGFEAGVGGGVSGGIIGGIDAELPPPSEPVRVGGSVKAPKLLVRVPPDYPAMAASAQMEGRVILEATVDDTGAVDDVRVLRSHAIFDEAAVEALKQWKYEPLVFNGRPTPFVLTVTLSFNLNARTR